MKKYFIASLLLSSCFIFSTNGIQAQASSQDSLAGTTAIPTPIEDKPNNEQEVLLSISQYLAEHLDDRPELRSYYNADIEFTISLHITEQGYIEQVTSSTPCKSPIASALIHELEKLEKVEPIVKNGIPVEREYRIPIRLQAR